MLLARLRIGDATGYLATPPSVAAVIANNITAD